MLLAETARFRKEERAQDLLEYTLILAAIVVLAAVLFGFSGDGMDSIWTKGDGVLRQAQSRL